MEHKDVKSGLTVSCDKLGVFSGEIIGFVEGSYTKVKIVDNYRGHGFDNKTQTFKGVKKGRAWVRGENKGYGQEHIVHRKELTLK